MPQTMLCAACMTYGPPEAMGVAKLPVPEPGAREILIRVAAATVNPADLVLRSGALAGIITGAPPIVGGLELSGVVAAAGPDSRWRVGARVAAIASFIPTARGAQCEFVVSHDDAAAEIPDGIGMAAAATIPMSGLTAQLAVNRSGSGDRTIAITGAGGAVGAFCVELAAAEGLRPIAVVRDRYRGRARALGAAHVVDADGDIADALRALAPEGVDAVIDAALIGEELMPAIRDGGRFIGVRPYDGRVERGISVEQISVRDYGRENGKLARLFELTSQGRLTPRVAQVLPFTKAAQAHTLLAQGGLGGRVVLTFDDGVPVGAE